MDCVYCKRRNDESVKFCEKCGAELLPIVDIDSLAYEQVSPAFANDIKNADVGLFNKGTLKKFVAAVEAGSCDIVQVKVDTCYEVSTSDVDDTVETYDTYCKIERLDKHPISHDIEVPNLNKYLPQNNVEAYLMRISIKNSNKYLLLPEKETSYIAENIKDVIKIVSNKTNKRQGADLIDLAAQKLGDFLGGVFNKGKK